MSDFAIEGIRERLIRLDDDLLACYGYSSLFEMVIVGGSALILTGSAPDSRFTTDIDVLMASVETEEFLARYDMNTDVSTFLYQYPENWKKRRRKIDFDGQVLEVFTLSSEDLAITKLLSWRESDKADLLDMKRAGNVDEGKLQAILDDPTELQINVSEAEWSALLDNVRDFTGW